MYLDTNDKSFTNSNIDCDIAIVGAGPAGIILAELFKNTKYQVCVLESGGLEPDAAIQQLSDGSLDAATPAIDKNYLSQHSIRFFGGTGNVWGGYTRQLDAVDFEQRGLTFAHRWPITKQDLLPYYNWHALEHKYSEQRIPNTALDIKYYEHTVYPFGALLKNLFVDDPNIRVILNATVTDLAVHSKNSLAHLKVVGSKTQHSFQVNAKAYVLACGGAGNVKLLLNANGVFKNGIGNEHDQLGRHFMEHPHLQFFDAPSVLWLADKNSVWLHHSEHYKPTLSLGEEAMRQHKLLNFSAMLSNAYEDGYKGSGANLYRPNFQAFAPSSSGAFYTLAFRCEQSPHPDNRVTLTRDKDALGMSKVHLHWQLHDADKQSLFRSIHLLAEELGKASLGRVRLLVDETAPWKKAVGGGHLMGTTRMSEKAEDGVVDRNLKLHGLDNLYVAGSSVFATAGVANPTLTVMALSRRLAAHLQQQLG